MKVIFGILSAVWIMLTFVIYWQYNPYYYSAFQFFQYFDLSMILFLLGGGIIWGIQKSKKKSLHYLNGMTLFGGALLLDIIITILFYGKVDSMELTVKGIVLHLSQFIGVAACLFLIYLVIRSFGILFTEMFPIKIRKSDFPIIQTAIGILILVQILFILGIFHVLYSFVLIPIFLLLLILTRQKVFQLIKNTLFKPIILPKNLNAVGIYSFLFLLFFLVTDFVQILRPFPLGTDSINLYANLPNLIGDYHGLVDGHQPYNWSLLMSLGLTIFGRIDVVLGLSFLGGLLSLLALFQLSRKWLNVNYAALCLLLFFSVPMINFLSYLDMKTDMGLLFILLSAVLVFYNWIIPPKLEKDAKRKIIAIEKHLKFKTYLRKNLPSILIENHLLILMGLLAGFAIGIKLTALIFFLALIVAIWYIKGGIKALFAAFFIVLGIIFFLQLDVQSGLRSPYDYVKFVKWGVLITGVGITGYLLIYSKKNMFSLLRSSLIFGCCFVLPLLPWLGKNLSETGSLSIDSLLNGKKANPTLSFTKLELEKIIIPGLYQMPKTIAQSSKKNAAVLTGSREDLHKFMGYEEPFSRYISLPFDTFFKSNVDLFFVDVGLFLIIFLPIIWFFPSTGETKKKNKFLNFVSALLGCLLMIIAIASAFLNYHKLSPAKEGLDFIIANPQGKMIDSINASCLKIYTPFEALFLSFSTKGNGMVYSFLIVLFVLFLTLMALRIKTQTKETKAIIFLLTIYSFLWWILGAGAAWYGILMFSLPYIFVLKGMVDEEVKNNFAEMFFSKKTVLLSICTLLVVMTFVLRTSNYNPINEDTAKFIYIPPIQEYQHGKITESSLMDFHFPGNKKIADEINKEDESLVYRIGTQLNFFIQKNDRRVFNDTFLDKFNSLIQEHKTKEQIITKLKTYGFKYIVIDLGLASNDQTPEKSLIKKFTQLMNTLYQNPLVELVQTNRTIRLSKTGEIVNAIFEDQGTVVNGGTIALFRIK